MKDKIEVSKIDIKIGDKTISLKPEQAKELKKILNEMFEESSNDQNIHHYWWNYPTQPYPYSPYRGPYWSITSGSLTGVSGTISNLATGYAATSNDVTLCLKQ